MQTNMVSRWKELLDGEQSFEGADSVVSQALTKGTRDELLYFLLELLEEFAGNSAYAGENGTLQWIKSLSEFLRASNEELEQVGIAPRNLQAYLAHA